MDLTTAIERARTIVAEFDRGRPYRLVLDHAAGVQERPWCYVFALANLGAAATGEAERAIVSFGPIVVPKDGSEFPYRSGHDRDAILKRYERQHRLPYVRDPARHPVPVDPLVEAYWRDHPGVRDRWAKRDTPLTLDEAVTKAREVVAGYREDREGPPVGLDHEYVGERPWCFEFVANSVEFLATGNFLTCLVGSGPLVIPKDGTYFRTFGSAHDPDEYLRRYEREHGLPHARTIVHRIAPDALVERYWREHPGSRELAECEATVVDRACRVCGLVQDAEPWGEDASSPPHAVCACCGTEFGVEDVGLDAVRWQRRRWYDRDRRWRLPAECPPDWDLRGQLAQISDHYR